MSETVEALEKERDMLSGLIASGRLKTSYEGRSVEYRSLDDMMRIRRDLDARIRRAKGAKRRSGVRYIKPGRGV